MRFRGNIILQYSIATFVIILVVSVVLGRLLVGQITDYQIRSHIRLYPELIDLAVKGNPAGVRHVPVRLGRTRVAASVESLLRSFFGLGTIFRVKVWSRDGTIVWSDSREEIGQKFPGDPPLVEALTGRSAAYELGESEKEENVAEKNKGSLLQVYTPVFSGGSPVGVIELYEANATSLPRSRAARCSSRVRSPPRASSSTRPCSSSSSEPTAASGAPTRSATG